MKRLIAATVFTFAIALANPALASIDAEQIKYCDTVGAMVERIAEARDEGAPKHHVKSIDWIASSTRLMNVVDMVYSTSQDPIALRRDVLIGCLLD